MNGLCFCYQEISIKWVQSGSSLDTHHRFWTGKLVSQPLLVQPLPLSDWAPMLHFSLATDKRFIKVFPVLGVHQSCPLLIHPNTCQELNVFFTHLLI